MNDEKDKIYHYYNCLVLWKHKIIREDLWVRNGIILDPKVIFFEEKRQADVKIDCYGWLICPGFIDIQINGGFSVDFSSNSDNVAEGIEFVAKNLLKFGVTSFCPTIVTSPKDVYRKIIPHIKIQNGSSKGAGVLGVHLEGPFISKEKKGAHPAQCISSEYKNIDSLLDMYGSLDNAKIITLAPELENSMTIISQLQKRGIVVSLGHSMGNLVNAENAVSHGATLITHLFNAMLPFHHRDPGIVGLLTSNRLPKLKQVFFGIISDGIHTHPAALRIAHRADPNGAILITDAIAAMGLPPGTHALGQLKVKIEGFRAYLVGHQETLAGSVATMIHCVKHFRKATRCSPEDALEAATLHPAQCLGIEDTKGTLAYGSDADFVMLDESWNIMRTYVAGAKVYDIQEKVQLSCS